MLVSICGSQLSRAWTQATRLKVKRQKPVKGGGRFCRFEIREGDCQDAHVLHSCKITNTELLI